MSKDAYWFRHDSTAGRGLKLRKIQHIYGHEGKGIYWDIVEILRDQEEYKFESSDSSLQLLADLISYKDESRFITWFKDCIKVGLFELINNNKYFHCPPLTKNMSVWETKKDNGSKGGRPKITETITETITESKAKHKANQKHNIIEHNSTEHNNTEEYIESEILETFPFDYFWRQYNKKVGNIEKIQKKWLALTELEREAIMDYIPNYVLSTPEKKFRKNPETFLNQRGWEDEIIANTKNQTQTDKYATAIKAVDDIDFSDRVDKKPD